MVDELIPTKCAGFQHRLAAWVIDAFVNGAALLLALIITKMFLAIGSDRHEDPAAMWDGLGVRPKIAFVIAYFVSLGALYVPLCHSSPARATVGKSIANIYVARDDGTQLSFARAFWRWFVAVLLAPPLGIGVISVLTILADSKRRSCPDERPA